MNPSYKIQIDVVLVKAVDSQNITMRHIRYVPFVPRSGDTLRLTSEDEEDTLDLSLDGIVYDTNGGMFVVEISDETLSNNYRETGGCDDRETVETYKAFGFQRVNYPTAQALRAVTA